MTAVPDWSALHPTITTGMDGTPMPTFADALTVEQRWQIVYFIQSLAEAVPQEDVSQH